MKDKKDIKRKYELTYAMNFSQRYREAKEWHDKFKELLEENYHLSQVTVKHKRPRFKRPVVKEDNMVTIRFFGQEIKISKTDLSKLKTITVE